METFFFFLSCSLKKKIPSRKKKRRKIPSGKKNKKKMSSFHLWDNPSFSDLTIRFADGDVPGHKVVFAQKSDVLRTFFEDTEVSVLDMTEHHRFFCQAIVYECVYTLWGNPARVKDMFLEENVKDKFRSPSIDELMEAVYLVDKYNMKESIEMVMDFLDVIPDENESSVILKWPLWTPNIQEEYSDSLNYFLNSFLGDPKPGEYVGETIQKLRTLPIEALCFWASQANYRDVLLCAKKMEDSEEKDSALAIIRMVNFTRNEMDEIWKNWRRGFKDENIHEEIKTKAISLLEITLSELNQCKGWERDTIFDLCKVHRKRKRGED
jgi:hypothetical protein